MNATVTPVSRVTPLSTARTDRLFHTGMAVAFLVTAVVSRLVDKRSVLALFLTLIFVVVAMIHDWKSRRRVHPVYIWGGAIVLVSGPLRAAIGNSATWQSFAQFLVG